MTHEVNAYDVDGNIIINLVQWDRDVYIYIHDSGIDAVYPMHFYNDRSESAYVVETAYADGVLKAKIPNLLLEQPYSIIGYVYIPKDNGYRSIYRTRIKVRSRPMPSDHVYEDTHDYLSIVDVLNECREYAGSAGRAADSAELSKNAALGAQSAAETAQSGAETAKTSAENAESNAKTYAEQAATAKSSAEAAAQSAGQSATDAEASAKKAQELADSIHTDLTEVTNEVSGLKESVSKVNNATEIPATAGKVWTSTENGAGWADPQGGGSGGAVSSVNGKTGVVELSAEDVHAIPDTTEIPTVPTKVSAFENDAGYLTEHQDIGGKVDKVAGKGLSTHDYDDAAKQKVDAIPENPKYTDTVYDDAAVFESLNQIKDDITTLQTALIGVEALADEITGVVGA